MGGCEFYQEEVAATAQEAFARACQEARHEHGHGGYTGTIAEKDGFHSFPLAPGDDPYALAEAAIYRPDGSRLAEVANDKWGPAACFDITETPAGKRVLDRWLAMGQRTGVFEVVGKQRRRVGPEPTIDGMRAFLFFGIASS